MNASFFHITFILSILTFIIIRTIFHRKAKRSRHEVELKESYLNMAVRAVVGIGYMSALLLYAFAPDLFIWAEFTLPIWARWVGAVVTVGSIGLIGWVQWALDVQFDTTLHIQADHKLITHGPYRWVRHPMYTTLFFLGLGWLLLTANWIIGAPLMVGIVLIVIKRVKNEEQMLIDLFGGDYRNYMQHTGRFLPKFSRS